MNRTFIKIFTGSLISVELDINHYASGNNLSIVSSSIVMTSNTDCVMSVVFVKHKLDEF